MLKLKTRHMFNPFHINLGGREPLQFSPIPSEDNELIQAIERDATYDQWNLESIDSEQLDRFWSSVEQDIASDPEWVHFSQG